MLRSALPAGRLAAPLKWSDWYLAGLKSAVLLLLVLFVTLLWLSRQHEAGEQREALIADGLWLEQSFNFRLESDAEHVEQLARDLVSEHAPEEVRRALFEARAKHLVKADPAVVQLLWLDDSRQLVDAVPGRHVPMLGGEERLSAAVDVARKMGKLYYTGTAQFGEVRQFEFYCPIFDGMRHQGTLVAVYTLNAVLKQFVPWWFADKYQVRILDGQGHALASKYRDGGILTGDSYLVPFEPPGDGLAFQLLPLRTADALAQHLLTALIVLLGAAVLACLWALRRHIERRLAAEQALRAEHAFRKSMEDSLTVGMRARDLAGRLTYANPAFCRMVGFTEQELMHRLPPMPYWVPEALDATRQMHDAAMRGETPPEGFELRFMRKNGDRFDVLIYEAPLIDADGKHYGWMASVVDVTARKEMEELARQQREKLRHAAHLVTMGEMSSTLAHELNQPLEAITGYATGCLNALGGEQASPAEMRDTLDKLCEQARCAERIVRRMHDFVRKSEPRLVSSDLAAIIDESIALIEPTARQQGVRIECCIACSDCGLDADPAMLEQVLLNVMRNAIEAMAGVAPERRVLRLDLSADRQHYQLRVADRGCGIPAENRDQLFSPFFTTKATGMGMGLTICRSIVEFHHGRLWVEDHPGGGTIFVMVLPKHLA